MPFYSFYCPVCQKLFDLQLSMKDVTRYRKCDVCGGPTERIIEAPQINMKSGYAPGMNGDHDMEVASDYYEHRLYSEDEQKKAVSHRKNLGEV